MTLKYEPKKLIRRLALKKKSKKLVNKDLSVNTQAVKNLADMGVLPKKALETAALKVIKQHKKAEKKNRKEGMSKKLSLEEALNEKKLIAARIQQAVLYEQTQTIKKAYRGEFYEWLPSTANVPDENHMLKYGLIFQLGKGEAPGDRIGCQCGMEILTDDSRSEILEKLEGVI